MGGIGQGPLLFDSIFSVVYKLLTLQAALGVATSVFLSVNCQVEVSSSDKVCDSLIQALTRQR